MLLGNKIFKKKYFVKKIKNKKMKTKYSNKVKIKFKKHLKQLTVRMGCV